MNIKDDSRKVVKGDIFVALKKTHDGHDYILDAIKNGASKVIVEEGNYDVETIVTEDTHNYLVNYLYDNYYDQIKNLKLIGMTGTNGKTTTCFLIYQALNKLGIKCAYIGTIGFYLDEKIKDLSNTTPDILEIYELLLTCVENNIEYVVMECSSHALDMKRLDKLKFKYGIFSNLTEDHLDYHKTMESYLAAKLKILNSMRDDGVFLVNADDEASASFEKKFKYTKRIGLSNSDYEIKDFSFDPAKTHICFQYEKKDYEVDTHLTGKFNVYNYLMTVAIVHEYGFSLEEILKQSAYLYPPKGRCETFLVRDGFAVVDYAHTPDAVLKVLETYREVTQNKIITVIGCGGDRDPIKRPIMGRIASEKSDYVIFTNDNPRTEDPEKIMQDILKGVEQTNYEVILDRHEAIKKALDLLNSGDVVLLLGKGHEDYQIIGHEKIHFDDREEIQKYMQNL